MAILSGLGFARVINFSYIWLVIALCMLCPVVRYRRLPALCLVLLTGVFLGGLRGTAYMHKLSVYDGVYDHTVTIVGQAAGDGTYGTKTQLAFDIKNAHLEGNDGVNLVGTVGVSGFGENMVFRGDTVQATGKLRPGTGSHQAWLSFAQLHATRRDNSWVEQSRRRFNAGMLTALPEPLASFGMGLLIGQHSSLPKNIYQDLLMVGLVHIIAVSGYNLTIILRACWRLLGKRSKYQTFVISLTLIGVFLLFTGASASIVRASIVSGLSMLAWYYGRSFKPVTLITLAAAITALANPLYVWGDMGWYLSFLAFYGVMVVAPQVRLRFVPLRVRDSLLISIALESLCAEIMTLPLVLYIFGQMSFISLAANVVIAVFVPLAMLLALVAGLAGMLIMPVAGWLAWPAIVLLTYMLDAAHMLAGIPHVFVEGLGLSLVAMLAMYSSVLLFSLVLSSRAKRKGAIITLVNDAPALQNMLLTPAAKLVD